MKLTRIELSGFKSFADTVELPFGEGITAIVGPNGCGKSNISDAVRWVLGEQRARLLRSTRMDEVIFHGSAKRRPISVAEITMYFDNSDGTLSIPYNEVAIARRVSRSGQSEYLLNQSSVRLRDLSDLLRGTGLGSAGVVIEAEMIDRLLSDRADERRSLFEEAAGISLYRDRKASTERRLKQTAEDLQRLDDVISEIQREVRSLARQRGKAERHRKFTDERFAIVMTLTRRRLARFDERESQLQSERAALDERIPQLRQQLEERERERESRVQGRATAEAQRTELERRLATTRIEIERLEGDIKLSGERLENATMRTTRAREERALAEARAAQGGREKEAAEAELQAAVTARESVQTELDLRAASEEEVRERFTEHRRLVRELETALQHEAESGRALAGEQTALERELEGLRTEATDTDERRRQATREYEAARQHQEMVREAMDARELEEREALQALERARRHLAAAREQEAAARVERRGIEESIAQFAARRDALDELEREHAGLAPAAQELLRARERFGNRAILGPLSDFLRSSTDEAPVAERLLADWLHAVLVRDLDVVDAVRRWHQATHGPLILLPVQPGPTQAGHDQMLTPGLVVSEPARAWVTTILNGARLMEQDGSAILRSNGAVYLAGRGNGGPLSRRAELDALERELSEGEQRLGALSVVVEQTAAAYGSAERVLENSREEMERARSTLREAQATADEASRRLHRADRDRTEREAAHTRLTQRIADLASQLQRITENLASGTERRTRLEEDLASQRAALDDLEKAQESARERRVHWQVEEAQVSAREQAARERKERAEAALGSAREVMQRLEHEIESIESSTAGLGQQRAEWQETLQERRVTVQELDVAARDAQRAVEEASTELSAVEHLRDETRAELERLNEEHHHLDLELAEATGTRRALVERIEAEWHKNIIALLEQAPDVDGETPLLEEDADRLAQAIDALGPVNPLAVDQHAEEIKRLEFLTGQRADLIEAQNALQQALREIDQTARAMFVETFGAVRENFHEVFHTLFEGGECDVRLADEHDPLNCEIEIRAAPRGKRTQRIHLLSSGERALVAISLLFAIYLTKPAPFCLLDEVDAPLDDANVMRFVRLLDEFKSDTQFIVITHNPRTMQVADAVYGVTMQEPGVSTIVGVRLGEEVQAVVT
jgi:chromosome segregation protein